MSRRPRVPARAMRAAVRGLVRPVLGPRMPVPVQRRRLDLVTGMTPLADGVDVRPGELAGRPVELMVPRGGSSGAVLYLHGGGFTIGSAHTHRALATHLAAASGATVHVRDYRLAPEHRFPAALDDTVAAYRELLARGADPAGIALAGDSAGGWLALTAALPLPAVLGLVSPRTSAASRRWWCTSAARRSCCPMPSGWPYWPGLPACRSSCAGGTGSGTSRTRPPAWCRRRPPPPQRSARAWRPRLR